MRDAGKGERCKNAVCYVNGNLLVALDRGDPEAEEFAEKHKGCLYTVGQIMDVDVPNAREIAASHDIQYRYVTKPIYSTKE